MKSSCSLPTSQSIIRTNYPVVNRLPPHPRQSCTRRHSGQWVGTSAMFSAYAALEAKAACAWTLEGERATEDEYVEANEKDERWREKRKRSHPMKRGIAQTKRTLFGWLVPRRIRRLLQSVPGQFPPSLVLFFFSLPYTWWYFIKKERVGKIKANVNEKSKQVPSRTMTIRHKCFRNIQRSVIASYCPASNPRGHYRDPSTYAPSFHWGPKARGKIYWRTHGEEHQRAETIVPWRAITHTFFRVGGFRKRGQGWFGSVGLSGPYTYPFDYLNRRILSRSRFWDFKMSPL